MKKSLIFAAVICLLSTTVLKAQDPGNMYISGSISMAGNSTTAVYGTESSKEPGGFTMSLTPQFGIFVIENLEVHLGLGYSFTRDPEVDINSSGDQVINSTNINLFTITPGINYYVPIVEYKFYYTPGLDLSVGFGGTNYKTATSKEKLLSNTTFGISLALLSFEYRPLKHFGVSFRAGDFTYGLNSMKSPQSDDGNGTTAKYNTNNVSFGLNLNATIGFRCYF